MINGGVRVSLKVLRSAEYNCSCFVVSYLCLFWFCASVKNNPRHKRILRKSQIYCFGFIVYFRFSKTLMINHNSELVTNCCSLLQCLIFYKMSKSTHRRYPNRIFLSSLRCSLIWAHIITVTGDPVVRLRIRPSISITRFLDWQKASLSWEYWNSVKQALIRNEYISSIFRAGLASLSFRKSED